MKQRKNYWVLLAICFVCQGALQRGFIADRWAKNYAPKGSITQSTGLSPDQFLFAMAGFRELIAGILWVRADSFFDEGKYDAILPLIRLVTILDPKQIDVYATGMWHVGYNFTDEEERSDRRYIPAALALGKDGAKNNPETYEMFFELGWIWFNKIDDQYDKAVKYFEISNSKPDAPLARSHILASAYQRDGRIEDALKDFQTLYLDSEKAVKDDPSYANQSMRDTNAKNLDTLLVRMSQRGVFAQERGQKDLSTYDTYPPYPVNFTVKCTVVEPAVIKLEGTWNVLPVGTRIRVVLRDADYPGAGPSTMDWDSQSDVNLDPPRDKTYMQDQLFIKNRRFNKLIDMSKDPTMYPFLSDKYVIEFYYNPRSGALQIQDKFGWNGEGMTDPNYLNTTLRPGTRIVFASFELTRDQLLRQGEFATTGGTTPSVKSKGFEELSTSENRGDVILVPSLRSGGT